MCYNVCEIERETLAGQEQGRLTMYDQVRLFWEDGSETIIYIHKDGDIQEVLGQELERDGLISILNYTLEGQVED